MKFYNNEAGAYSILIGTFIGLAHLALPKGAQSLVSKAHIISIISRSALFDFGQRYEKYYSGYEYYNLKLQNSLHRRLTKKDNSNPQSL
jgi:hypothetical protein